MTVKLRTVAMENVDVKEDIKGTSKDAVCCHQVMKK